MRLTVDHRTSYRFSEPQVRLVQQLRLTPPDTHDQTVADWHVAIDCDARMTEHRDGYGNLTTMLYVEGPVDGIEIAVTGSVVTSRSGGLLHGTSEPLPPRLFLRDTPATLAGEAIAAFAREVKAQGDDGPLALMHRLNEAMDAGFERDRARPQPGLTAEKAFARPALTARDMAQVLIAAARSAGVPARYVTGYCDVVGDHRPTPHGWVEAWIDGTGWMAFDPTLGLCPEEHHVRVAVALDAAGCAPVAGSRLGEGGERMAVDVVVSGDG